MMRNRFEVTPAGILAVAAFLLNILVISFGFTTHTVWFAVLLFSAPLLWFAMTELSREGKREES